MSYRSKAWGRMHGGVEVYMGMRALFEAHVYLSADFLSVTFTLFGVGFDVWVGR